MRKEAHQVLAAAIVEALETGNAIAPLPPELRPADAAAGEAVAEAVLDAMDIAPCGLRLLRRPDGGWIAGPVIEGRLMRDGAVLAMPALRHPRASAAVVAVLAEALEPGSADAPRLAALHPALDVAASRFRDGAAGPGESAADLAELGYVVVGRRGAGTGGPSAASCAKEPRRPKGSAVALAEGLAAAAAAARRLGGLPAGALLILAGLTQAAAPGAGERWTARLTGLGRASATFSAETGAG